MKNAESTAQKKLTTSTPQKQSGSERNTLSTGSESFSMRIEGEMQEQQTYLHMHVHRLSNLIAAEVEALEHDYTQAETPKDRQEKLDRTQRDAVLLLGEQLLESIKLSVFMAGARHKLANQLEIHTGEMQ